MFKNFIEQEKVVCTLLNNNILSKKISHAYIFSGKSNYKNNILNEFIFHIVRSKGLNHTEELNLLEQIKTNNYPEIYIVESEKSIKKEQIISLQSEMLKKNVLGLRKIYIIKNIDLLTKSAANTLLKFLEESPDNVVGILLTENLGNVIDTIKSRCQIILFQNKEHESKLFLEYYSNDIEEQNYEEFFTKHINLLEKIIKYNGDVISFIDKDNKKEFSENLELFLKNMIKLLVYILKEEIQENLIVVDIREKLKKNNKTNSVLLKLTNLEKDVKYNINKNLFFDKIIFTIGGFE